MTAFPVEWVLVVYYGPSAHRATYGRLGGTHYTKDYIQLSRTADFTEAIAKQFSSTGVGAVPLTYKWPLGMASGQLIFRSADRPHLAWETRAGAPSAWRMSVSPREDTAETIPGDPSHQAFELAERELALLEERGAGQPYLMAIKLQGEARTLHLRAYLSNPSADFEWASIGLVPREIRDLAASTSQRSALAWSAISSGGSLPSEPITSALGRLSAADDPDPIADALDTDIGRSLADYLEKPGYGLFFDPSQNHDAWLIAPPLPGTIGESVDDLLTVLRRNFPASSQSDAAAESLDVSAREVEAFLAQIEEGSFEVADAHATVKTRGSAQRAFSQRVRANYGHRCAITGIDTGSFLVAAHIVPWSEDQTIRLDPANGICLSSLMDRAFENGFILIEDDLTIRVNWDKVGTDESLRNYLLAFDGNKMSAPANNVPKLEYLKRRRDLSE